MAEPPPLGVQPIEPSLVVDAPLAAGAAPCTRCGNPLSPGDQYCAACGQETEQAAGEQVASEAAAARFLRCETCGAEIRTEALQRSYVCPFCDSTYVVEFTPDASQRRRPEFVLGFAITRQRAQQEFRRWLRTNRWLRPGDLTQAAIEEKQQGVYLPFWTFSTHVSSRWRASIGEYWYETVVRRVRGSDGKMTTRTERVRHTEWWPLTGRHQRYYAGFLVSASRGLSQAEAQQLQPFPLTALVRYQPSYLAGWMSEEYVIDHDQAWQLCQQHFQTLEKRNIAAFLPGDEHRQLQVHSRFEQTGIDLVLLPVHVLSYRYHDRVFRFLVNGYTGQFVGQKPVSGRRVAALVVAILLGIAVLVGLFLLLSAGA
ncbi:zinc ribbon domain-containing protein [Roseimaritima sediminicola]|uniref:zinc ribbon domain-containing protein n=1 Tax=Roseimaritima sediminicola TaxID=2662066 RepID=UPI0012982C9A|nr:zinc ribbon domain-containing protein [Roseimaritima sediminicola]